LDKLLTYIPQYNSEDTRFVEWAQKAELRFLELLTV